MKIQLIDKNLEMCKQWEKYFHDCDDIVIHNGDFFSLETDCVVSPANSFGFMDGGLDIVISEKLGWQIQFKLQKQIRKKYNGELLVGLAELIETENEEVPYCISAPTMRVPLVITDLNVYLASKAIFRLLKHENRSWEGNIIQNKIKTVTISGLGTGVGKVPYSLCAKQMRQAYDDIWLDKEEFPVILTDAQYKHYTLLGLQPDEPTSIKKIKLK